LSDDPSWWLKGVKNLIQLKKVFIRGKGAITVLTIKVFGNRRAINRRPQRERGSRTLYNDTRNLLKRLRTFTDAIGDRLSLCRVLIQGCRGKGLKLRIDGGKDHGHPKLDICERLVKGANKGKFRLPGGLSSRHLSLHQAIGLNGEKIRKRTVWLLAAGLKRPFTWIRTKESKQPYDD